MRGTFSILFALLVSAMVLSLHIGLRNYDPATVWAALTASDGSADHIIISSLRLPRTLCAAVVGAALGIAGLLMQVTLRNPLAEPGLLGINAGAAFAVVFALTIFGVSSLFGLSLIAILGAALSMVAVFAIVTAAGGGLTPISLMLAGVTFAALLASLTQVLIITDEAAMEALLFWLAGSFADRDTGLLFVVLPLLLCLAAGTLPFASQLDVLATDDITAQAVGLDVRKLRLGLLALASALAGLSVAAAGPVGFVGLVAPHVARLLVGTSHGRLLPGVLLIGALLAVSADILGRLLVAPQEAPITVTLALLGGPVFVALIRRRRLGAAI